MFERTRSSGRRGHVRADTFEWAARARSSGHARVGGAGTIFFEKRLSSPAKSKNASVLFVPGSRSPHTSGHKKYSIFDFSVELRMFFFRRWMPCCRLQIERASSLLLPTVRISHPPAPVRQVRSSEFHAFPCLYAKFVGMSNALHFRDIICSLKHP